MSNQEGNMTNQGEVYVNRLDKMGYIHWAMINNNVITTAIHIALMLADYTLILFQVLVLYMRLNVLPFNLQSLVNMIDVNHERSLLYVEEIAIFSYYMLIIALKLIMVFKKTKDQAFSEKTFIFKGLSLLVGLLRSVAGTLFCLILATGLKEMSSQGEMQYVKIFFFTCSLVLLAFIQYFQALFFNLAVPNSQLPWAETSSYPVMLDTIFKVLLSLAFSYRENLALLYGCMIPAIVVLGYKVGLRIKKSIMFNKKVYFVYMLGDTFILHLLILLLPASFFERPFYSVIALLTLPTSLLLVHYLVQRYNINWILNHDDELSHFENDKVLGYLQLLYIYSTPNAKNRNQLQQLHHYHQIDCPSYYGRLDKKLNRQYEQLTRNGNDDEENQDLIALDENATIHSGWNNNISDKYQQHTLTDINGLQHNLDNNTSSFTDKNRSMQGEDKQRKFQTFATGIPNPAQMLAFDGQSVNQTFPHRPFSEMKINILNIPRKTNQKTSLINLSKSIMSISQKRGSANNPDQVVINRRKMELNYKNLKRREKTEKRLVQHYFKKHLMADNSKDLAHQIIKIFFTIKVMENPYLAHFLIFQFIQQLENDNFLMRNQKLLLQKYLESFVMLQNKQGDELMSLNLQNILDLNQLLALFEERLEKVSDQVLKFWTTLVVEKETHKLYNQGLNISEGIKNIQKIYQNIELKQGERKEVKLYVQMSAFYKFVIFKNDECSIEIQKMRLAQSTLRLARDYKEKDFASQKALFIVTMSIKKPMSINFVNKQSCKLAGYDQKELIGMKINQLMPQLVSEMHSRFIDRFMQTGKYQMLSKKMENFIRMKNHNIRPVFTYLNVSHLNVRNMILIVQENDEFGQNEDELDEQQLFGHLMTNDKHQIFEVTASLGGVCGITYEMIEAYKRNYGTDPYIEDIFIFQASNLSQMLSDGILDFQVQLKHENLANLIGEDSQKEEIKSQDMHSVKAYQKSHKKNELDSANFAYFYNHYINDNGAFSMMQCQLKFHPLVFMNGLMKAYVVTVMRPQFQTLMMNTNPNSYVRDMASINQDKSQILDPLKNPLQKQHSLNSLNEERIEGFDMSSQTSTSTNSSTTMSQKFNQYQNSTNSSKIPSTLRFVLQLIIMVAVLVLTTSTVTVVLTLANIDSIYESINVSSVALDRLDSISTSRIIVRSMFNIAMNYSYPTSDIAVDRFKTYQDLVEQTIEELRQFQIELDNIQNSFDNSLGKVTLEYLSQQNSIVKEERYSSQSIMMYVAYNSDLLERTRKEGSQILRSNHSYFNLDNKLSTTASLIERQGYFIIENGNHKLYQFIEKYAEEFVKLNKKSMNDKIESQGVITWASISIIFLCCFVIIPLFFRIQNRVLFLMQLFLNVSKERKLSMIDRVKRFKVIFSSQKKNQEIPTVEGPSSASVQDLKLQNQGVYQDFLQHQHPINPHKGIQSGPIEEEKQEEIQPRKVKSKRINKKKKSKTSVQSQEDEEDEQNDDGKGKSKKAENLNEEAHKHLQVQQVVIKSDMMLYFQSFIKAQKVKQSLLILFLSCLFATYFIGTYFLATYDIGQMTQAIDIIFILFYRSSCVENVIHGVTETLVMKNTTILINDGKDEIMSFYQEKCQRLEQDFQDQVRKDRPSYLAGEALDYIELMEGDQMCQDLEPLLLNRTDSLKVTLKQCLETYNGLSQTGITNVYQTAYRTANQIRLELDNIILTQGSLLNVSIAWIIERIYKISPFLGLIELIIHEGVNQMHDKILNNLHDTIDMQRMSFLLLYAFFLLITLIVLVIFLIKSFKKLYREMQLSNQLLYIIDFELSPEEEKQEITKFLTKY